jgi:ferredoxin like protein
MARGQRKEQTALGKEERPGTKLLTLEDRLFLVQFKTAETSHLALKDPGLCLRCPGRPCTTVCPAGTYSWVGEAPDGGSEAGTGRLTVSYENCLECGACRISCPERNIAWAYPQGGAGVVYRYG